MTRRLLIALLLLAVPASAHAEVGDLSFLSCTQRTVVFEDFGCPLSPFDPGTTIAFSSDGARAYTYASAKLHWYTRNPANGTLTRIGCIGPLPDPAPCATGAAGIGAPARHVAISPNDDELYALTNGGSAGQTLIHFNLAADGTPSFGSCISGLASPAFGCPTIQTSLQGLQRSIVSPDSAHLYVSAGRVHHYALGANGNPTFQACYGSPGLGCTGAALDDSANGMAFSPDAGAGHLYVASRNLIHYTRNQATGALTRQGCVADTVTVMNACTVAFAAAQGSYGGVSVSPDGTSVYATNNFSFVRNHVFGFDRNTSTGGLTPDGCFGDLGSTSTLCPLFRGLNAAEDVVISPGGEWVYTMGEALTIFRRAAGGALTRIRCIQGPDLSAGCTTGAFGLDDSLVQLALPPGGAQLYVTSLPALTIFDRVEYVPPPAPDPTPLDETQGTRRSAEVAAAAPPPAAAPVFGSAPSPAGRSVITKRKLRNAMVRRCLHRPGRNRSTCRRRGKRPRATQKRVLPGASKLG